MKESTTLGEFYNTNGVKTQKNLTCAVSLFFTDKVVTTLQFACTEQLKTVHKNNF